VITLVPEGEATLDLELEATVGGLRRFGLPIAILTNTSLIDDPAVQRALAAADVVSLKFDAVDERIWHAVNRPHGGLSLPKILQDALAFSRRFTGRLLTETLLVRGINDHEDHLQALAGYLALIDPDTAYLSAPIRPPAEPWARPPSPSRMLRAHQILAGRVRRVEYLLGDEGTDFFAGADPVRSLLGIAGVHPIRRAAALKILRPCGAPDTVLERLAAEGRLSAVRHRGQTFYLKTPTRSKLPPAAH
jgi:wyosine [tRNA(Phe)-imidazoG37] synthetase (radical SAM superfamily)